MDIEQLAATLRAASDAYYNGGTAIMGDEAFDAAVEQLRALDPNHPFLATVGAPPPLDDTAVELPFPMPSLDKIKPGEDKLTRWLAATPPTGLVVSEKLDGLSALWMPHGRKLYLRGDGLEGQDVSHLVALGIQGLITRGLNVAVRGELILARSVATALGTDQARAWVNGLVHRKDPAAADVAKIRFVAYEVLAPDGKTRGEQFAWLESNGYEVPWVQRWPPPIGPPDLEAALKARRAVSRYDTDGLVVGYNTLPKSESTFDKVRNPKDCVAFKMPLAEQSAETTVRAVEWGMSAQGYLIPTLRFDPVQINGATIQLCTGHNAKMVEEHGIGPGARVVIRRSGDVIPKLDRVVTPAPAGPALPPAGSYNWDATRTHIRATDTTSKEAVAARLGHFLKTLELPGAGPATVAALVEGGIKGPAALWAAPATRLSELLGPKTGATLWAAYRAALARADEKLLMLASSQMPRGVGETKLAALFGVSADPRRWRAAVADPPAGWTAATLEPFWEALTRYESWRAAELGWIPYPVGSVATPGAPAPNVGTICMTGFRDKDLEAAAVAKGYTVSPTFTGKVTHLLVPDGPVKESEKTKAARAKGIPILSRSMFAAQIA